MNQKDFIYNQAFKQFMALGYTERDAINVAVDATRRWARQCKGIKAIEEAVILGKKQYKVVK